ncbi:hypothetical protein JHK86_049172 [Glycine max]|nr:hypothetical protein JHK86_049172 [Glycine max]
MTIKEVNQPSSLLVYAEVIMEPIERPKKVDRIGVTLMYSSVRRPRDRSPKARSHFETFVICISDIDFSIFFMSTYLLFKIV